MKMKKQKLNLRYGNKGFIFSLDALLAVLLTIVILTIANYMILKGGEERLSEFQLIKSQGDLISVLDLSGDLDSLDPRIINNSIREQLPERYGFRVNITFQRLDRFTGEFQMGPVMSFETGDTIEEGKFISTGKRFFLSRIGIGNNLNAFGVARYWIWLK